MRLLFEGRTWRNGQKKNITKGKVMKEFWRDDLNMAKTEHRWPRLYLKIRLGAHKTGWLRKDPLAKIQGEEESFTGGEHKRWDVGWSRVMEPVKFNNSLLLTLLKDHIA